MCPAATKCWWCGSPSHFKERCPLRISGQPQSWKFGKPIRAVQVDRLGQVYEGSVQEEVGDRSRLIREVLKGDVRWGEDRVFQTPISLGGVQVPKVILDTGAEVNVIPLSVCRRFGFVFQNAGPDITLAGFDGNPICKPIGRVSFLTTVGPSESSQIEFLVVEKASETLVGLPTLCRLKLQLDCATGEVLHKPSGKRVYCSVVKKNEEREGENKGGS